jgi:hypothetical protein
MPDPVDDTLAVDPILAGASSSRPLPDPVSATPATAARAPLTAPPRPETGGAPGPEPTRYGDWERAGRCIDF